MFQYIRISFIERYVLKVIVLKSVYFEYVQLELCKQFSVLNKYNYYQLIFIKIFYSMGIIYNYCFIKSFFI